jgi:hypothetical protein
VKCNAPANGFRHKQVLYWAHPAYLLLILCNLLVLLVVYLIVRKKAVFSIGLCEAHRKQRWVAITACLTGLILGVVLICVGIAVSMGWLIGIGALLMVTGAIWGVARGRLLAAVKIDKQNVWLTGAGKAFLDSLPDRPG